MRVVIETIPHSEQRYPSCGDWYYQDGEGGSEGIVRVSDMRNEWFEALVGIHEAIEATLCRKAGISEEEVTAYDTAYEKARELDVAGIAELRDGWRCGCEITADSEPGDDKHAPYGFQHAFATANERMMCAAMGLSWSDYCDAVEALG
jgi:hypothetical protein